VFLEFQRVFARTLPLKQHRKFIAKTKEEIAKLTQQSRQKQDDVKR
jgi:hypothetical protein